MKIELRIPTKTMYSYIQVNLDKDETLTKSQAKKIVSAYYLITKEYWGEVQGKIAKSKVEKVLDKGLDKALEKTIPLIGKVNSPKVIIDDNVAVDENQMLIQNIESADNLAMLEALEEQIKGIKGDKVKEVIMKKYNDKKIVLIDHKND